MINNIYSTSVITSYNPARKGFSHYLYWVDFTVLLFLLILQRMPFTVLEPLRPLFAVLCIGILAAVTIKNIMMSMMITSSKLTIVRPHLRLLLLSIFFISLVFVAYAKVDITHTFSIQTALVTASFWVAIFIMSSSIFLAPNNYPHRNILRWGIILAGGTYILFNVFFHFFSIPLFDVEARYAEGYADSSLGNSTILALLGLNQSRMLFPTAAGINSMGPIAGVTLVISLMLFLQRTVIRSLFQKVFASVTCLASIYVLLGTDSRFSLISVFLTLFFMTLPLLKKFSWFNLGVVLSPLVPLLLITILNNIDSFEFSVLGNLTRNTNDLITFNGRTYLWEAGYRLLSWFQPEHLWGFGFRSQAASANAAYLPRFPWNPHPELHNFALQYVFDLGYIGLLTFILLYTTLISRLKLLYRDDPQTGNMLMSMAVYFMFISTIETALTYYNYEVFTLLLLMLAANLPEFYKVTPRLR